MPDRDVPVTPLLEAMEVLSKHVADLVEKLDIGAATASELKRQSWWTRFLLGIVTITVVFGVVAGGYAIKSSHDEAKRNCQNANESRDANLALWTYVLTVAEGNAQGKEAKARITAIMDWTQILYKDHDCSNLDKRYKIPPPPTLGPG